MYQNAFIPSSSCINVNTETSSFFITGGPYDNEKSLSFQKFACVASCA